MDKQPYTIVIADDHSLVREGLRGLINATDEFKVVGEAGDGFELLALLKKIRPDMIVLDISMPGIRGIEAAKEIQSCYPEVHILFVTMHNSQEFLNLALSSGAEGYLLKDDSGSALLKAIAAIRNGKIYISERMAIPLNGDVINALRGKTHPFSDKLTHRERMVLKLIAEGKSNQEISDLLFISLHTAQKHRQNLRAKLGLNRTAELVSYAIAKGYIVNPP